MPEACVPAYRELCVQILEPIRIHFDAPMRITSGYRSPASNDQAHGVSKSQHIANAGMCAADFFILGYSDMRPVFDWIRSQSDLPFDQVILEHGHSADVVHVSWMKAFQRREALEGKTNNMSAYTAWSTEPGLTS